MQPSWTDLTAAYVLAGLLIVGLPAVFFVVTFAPGLMRTTGEHIGQSGDQHRETEPGFDQEAEMAGKDLGPRAQRPRIPMRPHKRRTFETTP